MENLTKNAVQFLDVLRMALSSEASQWDEETLTRAFDWAAFFEKVHSRLPSKPHHVKELDLRLKQMSNEMGLSFGEEQFGFDFLGQATRYLESVLLQNEHLDRELYRQVLEKYGRRGRCSNSGSALGEDVSGIRGEGAKMQFLQSALELALGGMTSKCSSEDVKAGHAGAASNFEVEAQLVREFFCWLTSHQTSNSKRTMDVLTSLVEAAGSTEIVIVALMRRLESEEMSLTGRVDKALTEWLVTRADHDATMWFDIDPGLLDSCSDMFPNVLEAYAGFLVEKVKQNQVQRFHPYNSALANGSAGIEKRFVSLAKKSEKAKKTCIQLLQAQQSGGKMVTMQRRLPSPFHTRSDNVWENLIGKLQMVANG